MHFFAKIFGHIKKKLYLCTRFWETSVFRFSTGARTLKFRFSSENLIFLRQTEGKHLWKIDTISVVQELIGRKTETINPPRLADQGSRKNSTLDKFDYSELSYNFFLQRRVWSWLRMNASDRPNTCKSRGSGIEACFNCRRPAHGCVTGVQSVHSRGIAQRKLD